MKKEAVLPAGDEVLIEVPISEPELWWPNGYGRQPLYQVEISLTRKDATGERVLDGRRYQVGLRTLELRQQDDAWGRSFVFRGQRYSDPGQRLQLDPG